MADEKNPPLPVMPEEYVPDVPKAGSALVRSPQEARKLARRMAGQAEDECLFYCLSCGWKGTLKFEPDEIDALGGDIREYGGPCTGDGCGAMTLRPFSEMFGGESSINQMAEESRRADYGAAADVFLDKAEQKFSELFTGGAKPKPEGTVGTTVTDESEPAAPKAPDPNTPAWVRGQKK